MPKLGQAKRGRTALAMSSKMCRPELQFLKKAPKKALSFEICSCAETANVQQDRPEPLCPPSLLNQPQPGPPIGSHLQLAIGRDNTGDFP